jgi:hypothetical protein
MNNEVVETELKTNLSNLKSLIDSYEKDKQTDTSETKTRQVNCYNPFSSYKDI